MITLIKAQQNAQKFVYRLKRDAINDKILKLTDRMGSKDVLSSRLKNTDATR
jgi:hypothetical protein